MSILDFNAYTLEYFVEAEGTYDENGDYTTEGYYDDNGDWQPYEQSEVQEPNEGQWVAYGRCNAVPAGRNNLITLPNEDGRQAAFSFTIILHDPKAREFVYGERIRLTTIGGMETIELSVKGFARYQHQCKIYA